MSQIFTHSLAACAALFLALGSIGTIVTVPPAHALSPIVSAELA